jgi:hypothetical protein
MTLELPGGRKADRPGTESRVALGNYKHPIRARKVERAEQNRFHNRENRVDCGQPDRQRQHRNAVKPGFLLSWRTQ